MTQTETGVRPFRVLARHEEPHHGHVVTEATFEAAAMAYVEHLALPADLSGEVMIVVHDLETGHEQRFHVRLDHGVPIAAA